MKPRRIILIRHGESQGNRNPESYATIPDYALELTDTGKQQAFEAGKALRQRPPADFRIDTSIQLQMESLRLRFRGADHWVEAR